MAGIILDGTSPGQLEVEQNYFVKLWEMRLEDATDQEQRQHAKKKLAEAKARQHKGQTNANLQDKKLS